MYQLLLFTLTQVILMPENLVLTAAMMGFSFGGMYSIAPNITGTLFGFKHFGANWGTLVFGQGWLMQTIVDSYAILLTPHSYWNDLIWISVWQDVRLESVGTLPPLLRP